MNNSYQKILEETLFEEIEKDFKYKYNNYFGEILNLKSRYDEIEGAILNHHKELKRIADRIGPINDVNFEKALKKSWPDCEKRLKKLWQDYEKEYEQRKSVANKLISNYQNIFKSVYDEFKVKVAKNLTKLNPEQKFAYLLNLEYESEQYKPDNRMVEFEVSCLLPYIPVSYQKKYTSNQDMLKVLMIFKSVPVIISKSVPLQS